MAVSWSGRSPATASTTCSTREGRPVEAIPGLYGPKAFLAQLANGRAIAETAARSPNREEALSSQHTQRRREAMINWIGDLEKAGVTVAAAPTPTTTTNSGDQTPHGAAQAATAQSGPAPRFPRAAVAAARLAIGKGAVETRLIAEITRHESLATTTSPGRWRS